MADAEKLDYARFVAEIDHATPALIKGLAQTMAKNCTSEDAGRIVDFWKFLDNGRLPIDSRPEDQEFYKRTVARMVEAGVLGSGYLDLVNEWRFVRGKDGPKKA
jgi:hypothetical protein